MKMCRLREGFTGGLSVCSIRISEDFLGEVSLAPDALLGDSGLQLLAKSWYFNHLFPIQLLDLKTNAHTPTPKGKKKTKHTK